jgi:AGCS family alanine or glycine:cation symporter
VATGLVAIVAFGGVERIGTVTARLVPAMCLLYLGLAIAVLIARAEAIPGAISAIFTGAFTGRAAVGGAAGLTFIQVVLIGVKRGAFSNEAGIGTATLAHGAARTDEPVREGLVAMLGPFIDTIMVCSLTAMVILVAVDPNIGTVAGVSLTALAFSSTLGAWAQYALILIVLMFALSTMISYSYYGKKCFTYLFGGKHANFYTVFYLGGLFLGGIWSAALVINLIDTAFALMAFPNMIATLLLAPKVLAATRDYLGRLDRGET